MSLLQQLLSTVLLFLKIALAFIALFLILLLAFPIGFYGMALYMEPNLPSIKELKTAPKQMPLQIYSSDNQLIGNYGNRMSLPVAYEDIPKEMIQAFLAAEDEYFFEHSGISVKGLGRAVTQLLTEDSSQTGGSTITMQVAKNYFLTPEQTFKRKLTELFLSRKIEQKLSKDEILSLYVNKIYLGEGAYGIKAAAKKYYSKSLEHLTIAETAMLAGLPKAPSAYNPVVNPKRALTRRNWILKRMLTLGYINKKQYKEAVESPIGLHVYKNKLDNEEMKYISEMVRISLVNQFGSQVMNSGWKVRLTIDSKTQEKADTIMRKHLLRYDRVRGWRGPEAKNKPLANFNSFLNMHPVKVTKVNRSSFEAVRKSGKKITVPWSGMGWRRYRSANGAGGYFGSPASMVEKGDIVRVSPRGNSWKLVQVPKIQGSLVSLNPEDGSVIALVGGFHFLYSKFNRATDAWRQPGSTIKPLIYSAALEKGYTPHSLILDSPLKIGNWRPKNSDGRYYGAMPLRQALYLSRNLVSIRLLRSIGMSGTLNLLDQFGLDKEKLPTTLSLALGAGKATPLQMATAYSTFANGGHRIQPYLIKQIYDFDNNVLYQANPAVACALCKNDPEAIKKEAEKEKKRLEALKDKNGDNPKCKDEESKEEDKDKKKDDKKKDKEKDKDKNDKNIDCLDTDTKDTETDDDVKDEPEVSTSIKELEAELSKTQIIPKGRSKKKTKKGKKDDKAIDADAKSDRLVVKAVEQTLVAEQAPRILSPSVSYEMAGILKDVIQKGTATRAQVLGRVDIGGKTGTTNNFRDAWFAGFHPTVATVVWMGFDQPSTLGKRQYGGRLALPVWIDFMRYQLQSTPTQWVSIDNEAKTKKQKADTIDLTDEDKKDGKDGDNKDEQTDDKDKNSKDKSVKDKDGDGVEELKEVDKLPTGKVYPRVVKPSKFFNSDNYLYSED